MAEQLVEAMTESFDPARYKDEYREALLQVIEAKVEGAGDRGAGAGRGEHEPRRPDEAARGERQGRDGREGRRTRRRRSRSRRRRRSGHPGAARAKAAALAAAAAADAADAADEAEVRPARRRKSA